MNRRPHRTHGVSTRALWLLALACLGAFVMYMVFSGRGVLYLYQLNKRGQNARTSNERLVKENKELRVQIQRLKTDRAYQEEIARKELGLVRENEVIYSFEEKKRKTRGER